MCLWCFVYRHFKESGMVEELREREYRKTTAEEKFNRTRAAYNKKMGVRISDRLKWVVRRRKLKMCEWHTYCMFCLLVSCNGSFRVGLSQTVVGGVVQEAEDL